MSTMIRWVLIGVVWVLVAGVILYSAGAFITGHFAIMDWHPGARGVFAFMVVVASIMLTCVTSDVEQSKRRSDEL